MNIEEMKSKLLNLSKGSIITEFSEESDKISDWFTIPSYDLNRILSGSLFKTVQAKNHLALVGEETTGKSSIAALIAKDCQNKGYIPIIIDCEGNWSANNAEFCKRWGLDINNMLFIKSIWIEDISLEMARIAENKMENMVIIIDSLGAMDSKKVLADALDKNDIKADQGQLAKRIKRLLKIIVSLVKFNNSILLTCGHIYSDPNSFSEKLYGGNYFKLSSDIILRLFKYPIYENPSAQTKKDKGKVVGNEIIAFTQKNRIAPEKQEAKINIEYTKGFDKLAGIIDLCLNIGFITRSGAWYTCETLKIKSQGVKNLKEDILASDYHPLLEKIEEYLKTTGYSSVNKDLELNLSEEPISNEEPVEKEPVEKEPVEKEPVEKETSSKKTVKSTSKKRPGRPKKKES